MRIDIITVLPEMLEGFFNCSIMSRAQKKGIAEFHIHNLRDYTFDRYRKVDDYPLQILFESIGERFILKIGNGFPWSSVSSRRKAWNPIRS